jgi:hypothetical protein
MARSYQLGPAGRVVHTVMAAMLCPGVGSKPAFLLATIGRKTRLKRTTLVIVVESGGVLPGYAAGRAGGIQRGTRAR